MPELPEVETTCRGIAPHLKNRTVTDVVIANPQLRWPIPTTLKKSLLGKKILSVSRRAKYLLISTENGTLILHLGMSGSLRIVKSGTPLEKHDHFELLLNSGKSLRLNDPRRFGAVLWSKQQPLEHPLLVNLGPEPLTDEFGAERLFSCSRKRQVSIKQFIMDNKIVVGVGNIYASEALFRSGIRPTIKAGKISRLRFEKLTANIKSVLAEAIEQGGTTLKDFTNSDGKPGYFQQKLDVYGRTGEQCHVCDKTIKQITQGQRSSYYCPHCQT